MKCLGTDKKEVSTSKRQVLAQMKSSHYYIFFGLWSTLCWNWVSCIASGYARTT